MIQHLLVYFIAMNVRSIYGSCNVARIRMRVPREHDTGLIFDLTVSNSKKDRSEVLDFSISSDDVCTLNMTSGQMVRAGTIFGGDFGIIEPGNSLTISLMWPTVSSYNRVGSCPIIISSVNHENEVTRTKQILYFDTRFEILDPSNYSLRRRKDFTDCNNWDKDYFFGCTPLNCEERYFGKRSFYNCTSEQCEPVPACLGDGVQYDFYANECVDTYNFIEDDEIEQLERGQFDNNYLELKKYGANKEQFINSIGIESKMEKNKQQPSQTGNECKFGTKLTLVDFNNCFHHLNEPKVKLEINSDENSIGLRSKKSTATSIFKSFYYDWYLPLNEENEDNDKPIFSDSDNTTSGSNSLFNRLSEQSFVEWISLITEMLLIISLVIIFQVVVTIVTYTVVCLILYGFMEFLAELKPYKETGQHLSQKLTPRQKHSVPEVMTSASLMSQLK